MDFGAVRDRVETFLAGERPNWPGWLAVALGLGIAGYFGLPVEPPLWLGAAAAAVLLLGVLLLRRHALPALVLAAVLAAALGFAGAQVRAALVAAPQLQDAIRFAHVTGRVIAIEPFPGSVRATLDQLAIAELPPAETPLRIQVKIGKGSETVGIGDRLDLLARLQPAAPPVAPGAFDFRRQSFFAQIGARGFAMGAPRILEATDAVSATDRVRLWIDRQRAAIGRRIAGLEPNAAGAMARALTVGDQTALSKADTEAMRISGLAHLLSISGLHIGMAAGLFFFGLRGLLALVPRLALRHPIKKWSAAAAILAAGYYALLAGATVPTLRSFLMIMLAFIAVLLDRSPISFRLLAWAAVVLLLLQPETLTGASFQMSFFAVLGLIAAFEALRPRIALWRGGRSDATDGFGQAAKLLRGAVFWLATTMVTSVIASLMTAPFAMYHFDRISSYGVIANLVAVPLTGFWVMPMGMAALLLMPFGLDAPFWHAAAWGCDGILWIARTVAAWPYASLVTPAMPQGALIAIALGLVALCLMRSRWRLLGAAPVAAGLAALAFVATPDLLVSGDAKLLAVKDAAGAYRLSSLRAGKLAAETWLRRNGQVEAAAFPSIDGEVADDASAGSVACDRQGCVTHRGGRVVALARTGEALAEDCAAADVVISAVPIRGACPGPRLAIDRFDVWRGGAHAVWIAADGRIAVESVAEGLGRRPWVLVRMQAALAQGRLVGDPVPEEDPDADGEAADDEASSGGPGADASDPATPDAIATQ